LAPTPRTERAGGLPAPLTRTPFGVLRPIDAASVYARPRQEFLRLTERGCSIDSQPATTPSCRPIHNDRIWQPTLEAAAYGIAATDHGVAGAVLMGLSAARLHGAIPRALAVAVVAIDRNRPTVSLVPVSHASPTRQAPRVRLAKPPTGSFRLAKVRTGSSCTGWIVGAPAELFLPRGSGFDGSMDRIGIGIVVLLLVVGIPLWQRQKQKFKAHNDEMQAWAASHGCGFALEDNSQYEGLSFYPFGHDRQTANRVITGKYAERNVAVYDFYFTAGGGTQSSDVYFAMIVMQLPTTLPWLDVSKRIDLSHKSKAGGIGTGDEAFDTEYALFANDQESARSAVSATVRTGLPAQDLSGMHILNDRLFLWRTRRKHDVARIEDRLRFAATVVAELASGR
jgi:hypothetical protein